jgi:hypothetical protein
VQDEQSHTPENRFVHARDDLVGDLIVGDVPPPGQDIGLVEHAAPEPVLRLLESRGPHPHALTQRLRKARSDRGVHPVRVQRANLGLVAFVDVLAPHGDPQDFAHTDTN